MNIVHSDGFGKSIRVWFYTYLRGNTSMDVRDDLFFNLHSCKWKEKKKPCRFEENTKISCVTRW